tara:strand:+ start:606 stop:1256 length:651 start_codon:yes stop_codon:yes gene_type:complete
MQNQEDKFWVDEPLVLLKNDKIQNLWPKDTLSYAEKWNSITRMVILLSILGYILRGNLHFLIVGLITLALIIFLYHNNKENQKIESFITKQDGSNKLLSILKPTTYESTSKNPMSNLLLTHIQDEPNRPAAPPSFTKDNIETINNNTKTMIKELNDNHKDIDKRLFQDLGDNFQFDQSMRSFYTPSTTTNPNAQEEFAKFCYGDMPSRKVDMSTNS